MLGDSSFYSPGLLTFFEITLAFRRVVLYAYSEGRSSLVGLIPDLPKYGAAHLT